MELLEAGQSGELRGHEVPQPLRPLLVEAALRLMAVSADSPRAGDDPWLNLIVTETRSFDGAETRTARLETHGATGTRLPWQQAFCATLAVLAEVGDAARDANAKGLAAALNDILLRLNLQWYAVDALRSDDAVLAFAGVMAKIGRPAWDCGLREGFPPLYLIAHGACVHEITEPTRPTTAAAWREIGYQFWDSGDDAARRARRASSYSELVIASFEALLWYEAAVRMLLHHVLPALQSDVAGDRDELIKDWGVVEEFRVGALEVIRSFGRSLTWRPAHFLQGGIGKPLGEAVRRAVLAARGQISVYPDLLTPLWTAAAAELGREIMVTEDNWLVLSFELEASVAARVNDVFDDPTVADVAARLREARKVREPLRVRPDWARYVFWGRATLIAEVPDPPLEGAPKTYSVATRSASEREYLKTVLGLPAWPFVFR